MSNVTGKNKKTEKNLAFVLGRDCSSDRQSAGGLYAISMEQRYAAGPGLREFLEQAQQLAVELVAVEVLVGDVRPAGIQDAE